MIPKAFIFDFDGVIVDSERKKFEKLNNLMSKQGYPKICSFESTIGKKTELILRENYPELPEEKILKIIEKRRKDLRNNIDTPLISGIRPLLKWLKKQKTKIAITTGTEKKVVTKVLEHYSLELFFDILISGEDFQKSKPSPECYLLTLKKLFMSSKEVIVIEDSQAGIESAKSAGCKVIGMKTYTVLEGADKYFDNHTQILEYFSQCNFNL